MNIILCGMPCSGKTFFGKKAAEALSLNFIDTDDLIMQEYFKRHNQQATCREIAITKGDSYFRALEHDVIKGLDANKSIIAVGGGALGSNENLHHLKKIGRLVYLKTPQAILLDRLMKKTPLPSYLDANNIEKSFMALLEKRLSIYRRHCQYTIDTASEDVIETLKEIKNGK